MIRGTVIALVASGCTSIKSISLNGYMAARFFQGFGTGPAATRVGTSALPEGTSLSVPMSFTDPLGSTVVAVAGTRRFPFSASWSIG